MDLSELAADLEVTAEQRDRGVATVDDTDAGLAERLEPYVDRLPCSAADAAAIVEAYADGASLADAGARADQPPMTAAKTLHLVGIDEVCPLEPAERDLVAEWIAGVRSRTAVLEQTGASEAAFHLAAYVQTHEPIEGAREAVEPVLGPGGNASVAKRDRLAETMSDAGELYR